MSVRYNGYTATIPVPLVVDAPIGSNPAFAVQLGGVTKITVDNNGSLIAPLIVATPYIPSSQTSASAPVAGGAGALPATPAGYWLVSVNGTTRKIPYY